MAANEIDILCIGNALVDVYAQNSGRLDLRFGLTEPVQHVDINKIRDILLVLPELSMVSGGGAANVAKIAGLLNTKAHFTGSIGRDKQGGEGTASADRIGRFFENELHNAGVKLRLSLKESPTGICLVLGSGDDHSCVAAAPSAALELSPEDIAEEDIQKANVMVIDGYMLERQNLIEHLFTLADRYGTVVALDLSSQAVARQFAPLIYDYARRYSVILFMNEEEAAAFYAELLRLNLITEKADADSFFLDLTKKDHLSSDPESMEPRWGFPIILIKLGPRGSLCIAEGTLYRADTRAVIPLETTGAGDAFCAAFLAAWVRSFSLSECAAFGNRAGSLVLDGAGTMVDKKKLRTLSRQLVKP
ncbi:MAG: PfkB family carbohydrate kinase [Treponema sp.]|nr:PfkB family carbohydrate kinase [Treponema sp.]